MMNATLERDDLGFLGYWWWDLEEDLVITEGKLDELFGVQPRSRQEGLPLASYEKSIHPDDLDWVRSEQPHCFGASGHGSIEYRIIDPTGAVRWLACRGIYETDAQGNLVRARGMLIDITELKLDGVSVRTRRPEPMDHEGALIDASMTAFEAAKALGDVEAMRLLRAVLEAAGRRLARQLSLQRIGVH